MRSHMGWQLQGMGDHCPEDGRGKLGGVVSRQSPRSALQAIQPLWTVPCSLTLEVLGKLSPAMSG